MIQYHDMPQQQQHQPTNPSSQSSSSSRGRVYPVEEGSSSSTMAAEKMQYPVALGHHSIQSRTKSPSHGLSKRERSRSRGRKQPGRPTTTKLSQRESSNNFGSSNASSRFSEEESTNSSTRGISNLQKSRQQQNVNSAVNSFQGGLSINEFGRCVRHPQIELCCRDSIASPWMVVLQECPLCCSSLDLSKLHKQPLGEVVDRVVDGASSSQPSTSTITNRTSTEEESSAKSWTMSEASSVGKESKCNNSGAPTRSLSRSCEPPLLNRRTPSPRSGFETSMGHSSRENSVHPKVASNPVQLLKELGRKLVIESETSAAAAGGGADARVISSDDVLLVPPNDALSKRPPPPPYVRSNQTTSINSLENNVTSVRLMRGYQPKSSSERTSSQRTGANASSFVSGGGVEGSNESILVEASNIIARMESLTQGELTTSYKSRTRSSRSRHQSDIIGEGDSAEKIAAEKVARMQRRKEKALKNAAKLKAREQQRQQQESGAMGVETTHSMKDHASSTARRGRDGPRTSDILLEAAQMRVRARRSASRSRERLKAAAIFCGETPLVDNTEDWDSQLDDTRELLTTERKRSILNPHGLENQPIPPAIERRSQSRERKWSGSERGTAFEAEELHNGFEETRAIEGRRRSGSHGRNRAASLSRTSNQQSAAEELLNRRRDMRQKIVDMKSSVQSRTEQRRTWGTEQTEECYPSNDDEEEWVRSPSDFESIVRGRPSERRRGRSRSSVRDSYSRIRSSSLNVFRKKGGVSKESDGEDEVHTVDSGRLSMASLKHMISRCRPRSLSVSRRRRRTNQSDAPDSWLIDSEISAMDKRRGDFDSAYGYDDFERRNSVTSDIGTTAMKSSSALAVFDKFLPKKKHPNDTGYGRSQKDKQNSTCCERWEAMSEGMDLGSRGW